MITHERVSNRKNFDIHTSLYFVTNVSNDNDGRINLYLIRYFKFLIRCFKK